MLDAHDLEQGSHGSVSLVVAEPESRYVSLDGTGGYDRTLVLEVGMRAQRLYFNLFCY